MDACLVPGDFQLLRGSNACRPFAATPVRAGRHARWRHIVSSPAAAAATRWSLYSGWGSLLLASRPDRLTNSLVSELLRTIDIGPTRTMQQDVEFGVIQIVDIALRAISPAVNDPSTAISCVDQLSRILIRWISRAPPPLYLYDSPHVLRIVIPWIDLEGLLDTAFEQIRHYSVSDVAVSLRLLRAFGDIAITLHDPPMREALRQRGRSVVAGCEGHLPPEDVAKLLERAEAAALAGARVAASWGGPDRCGASPARRDI